MLTQATSYQDRTFPLLPKPPCAPFQPISRATPARNTHWSYSYHRRLVLTILELHINGIISCVALCASGFFPTAYRLCDSSLFSWESVVPSLNGPVIFHCTNILFFHSLQSFLPGFFLPYLRPVPLAIPLSQSSNAAWVWPLLPHALLPNSSKPPAPLPD